MAQGGHLGDGRLRVRQRRADQRPVVGRQRAEGRLSPAEAGVDQAQAARGLQEQAVADDGETARGRIVPQLRWWTFTDP